MTSPRHPIQPLVVEHGVVRFKPNAIVRFLLDAGPFDLNQLASMPFEREDREQLAQLIGYSLSGFAELPYVSDETFAMINGDDEAEQPSIVITGLQDCAIETIRHADHIEIKVTVDEPEPDLEDPE